MAVPVGPDTVLVCTAVALPVGGAVWLAGGVAVGKPVTVDPHSMAGYVGSGVPLASGAGARSRTTCSIMAGLTGAIRSSGQGR